MRKSFTLVELLIVVLIVGILATVALPQYQKVIARAKEAEALTNLGHILMAQNLYYVEHGDYSRHLATLDVGISFVTVGGVDFWATPEWAYETRWARDTVGGTNDTGYKVSALRRKPDGTLPTNPEIADDIGGYYSLAIWFESDGGQMTFKGGVYPVNEPVRMEEAVGLYSGDEYEMDPQ